MGWKLGEAILQFFSGFNRSWERTKRFCLSLIRSGCLERFRKSSHCPWANMFSTLYCQNEKKRPKISEKFWSHFVFLAFPRVGCTKTHPGETNAFFPLFLPEVKSILHSSIPTVTRDSKIWDFIKLSNLTHFYIFN